MASSLHKRRTLRVEGSRSRKGGAFLGGAFLRVPIAMIFGVATEVEDPEGDGQYPATHPGDQADGDAVEISAGTEYQQEHSEAHQED